MSRLQVQKMEREDANILAMRARNEDRSQRFLDARARNIGIDVPALQSQVEEKLMKKTLEREKEQQRVHQERQILMLLEQRELEEERAKKEMLSSHVSEWATQKREINLKRAQEKDAFQRPTESETCGLGALQKFDGEDREKKDRLRLQAEQMRNWIYDKTTENEVRKQMEKEEEARHVDYQRMVNNARALLDEEDANARKNMLLEVQEENRQKIRENSARRRAQKEAEDFASTSEVAWNLENPILTEDMNASRSMLGPHRIRPGHFKGFSHEERMKFYQENEQVIQEKARIKEAIAAQDREWALEQARVQAMVERAEAEEQMKMKALKEEQIAELAQQRREELKKKEISRKERFGQIEQAQGYYSGFGKSGR